MLVSHYIDMVDMIDKKRKEVYSRLSNKLFLSKSEKNILKKYDDLYFKYLQKLEYLLESEK
jgi:hypothetical protein